MRWWLFKIGEPIPFGEEAGCRPGRCGLLATELRRRGHEVVWWSSAFDHQRKCFRRQENGPVVGADGSRIWLLRSCGYPGNRSLWRVLDHIMVALEFRRRWTQEARPDGVVAALPSIELAWQAVGVARRLGVPCVVDVRDLWPDAFGTGMPRVLRMMGSVLWAPWRVMAGRALRGATALMAPSEGYLQWAVARAGRTRQSLDRVFPLGFPLGGGGGAAAVRERARRRLGVADGVLVVWFVGSFGISYDLATIVEAARRAFQEGDPSLAFVLTGEGDASSSLRQQAGGLPNVHFTGWAAGAALEEWRAAADVGLAAYVPGAPQGIPNKVIEYLAGGLPVISSLPGESRRLLDDRGAGLPYRAGDAGSLLQAVRTLQRDPERRDRMSRAGREAFRTEFDAVSVYGRMADHLESLGGQPRLPASDPAPTG